VVIRIGHLRMRSLRPHMPGRVKPSLPSSTTDSSAAVSPPSVSRTGLANGPVPALPAATPAGTCAPAASDGGSGGALRSAGFPAILLNSLDPEGSHYGPAGRAVPVDRLTADAPGVAVRLELPL
jgi:hypothetical protein